MLQRCGGPAGAEPYFFVFVVFFLDVAFFDHRQDVVFTHDEVFVPIELDLLAGVLAEQNAVARLHVERDALAIVFGLAITRGDDFALLRLFLRAVGDNDSADFLFAFVDALNNDAVV